MVNMFVPFKICRFSIDATSGVITVTSGLDRESTASYKLTVVAADRGIPSRFSSRDVIITVVDVNDNDPIFQGDPYSGSIAEDASVRSPVVQVQYNLLFCYTNSISRQFPRCSLE